MEQVGINQGSQVMPTIPAGVSIHDVTGIGAGPLVLSTSEAAADIIILQGVLTASISVVIPTAAVPTQVIGTNASTGLSAGWVKIVRNNCTGGVFTVAPIAPSGVPVALAQAKSQLFWSPDGIVSFQGGDAVT